ncbi:uroporphyrinogen-III synthase [Sphingomicrobium flavum]|uniref:uroporphyrinogen-III synthase n=1 Tax=Sphingomicrobium flavum TaxID=1229164 RepID=UPI0021AD8CD9|nr:uroporphyrinogen-III synthase [Sphingomicrobium flavum]
MKPLILLRPEPGTSLTAERAESMGFAEVIKAPLFKVRPVDWTVPEADRFDAMLLTSANAPRHAGAGLEALRRLPVHAVGEATAKAARAAGLMVDTIGDGGITELLDQLGKPQRLLHLCGQHRRAADAGHHTIIAIPVYSAIAREEPSGLDRLEGSVACIHSPRAGARIAELVEREQLDRSAITLAAISAAAAEACGEDWENLSIAKSPDDASLLALAKRLCEDAAS